MRAGGVAVLVVVLAGCGGGGGGSESTSTPASSPPTTTATSSPKAKAPETPSGTTTSGKKQPGGAGGETPAHFDASLTGRGGKVSPRNVAVVPFISVRVILKSGDSSRYTLTVNGKTLASKPGASAQLTLPGLKPGRSYVLRDAAGGPSVTIVANAEPGP